MSRSSAEGLDLAQQCDRGRTNPGEGPVGCRSRCSPSSISRWRRRRHREASGESSAAFRSAVCKAYSIEGEGAPSLTAAEVAEVASALGVEPTRPTCTWR